MNDTNIDMKLQMEELVSKARDRQTINDISTYMAREIASLRKRLAESVASLRVESLQLQRDNSKLKRKLDKLERGGSKLAVCSFTNDNFATDGHNFMIKVNVVYIFQEYHPEANEHYRYVYHVVYKWESE